MAIKLEKSEFVIYSEECIAAIATPTLKSGLGVIRVSGSGAIEKVSKIFKPAKHKNLTELKGYEAAYGFIVNLEDDEVERTKFNYDEFEGGKFEGGKFEGGKFEGGKFEGGKFEGGKFEGGKFEGGKFEGGKFEGGKFEGGKFEGGKFEGGDIVKGSGVEFGVVKCSKVGGSKIDDAVVLVFRSPHSYTGEDVVELSCHGGVAVLNLVLKLCFKIGCRPALNGEFTKRAFLNGKLSLTQAEAVYDLINADSNLSFKAASSVKNGFLFKKTQHVCNELVAINASLEAFLNYPDEGVDEPDAEEMKLKLGEHIQNLQGLVSNFGASNSLKNGIKTVLVGVPNVGKSTLMNLLAGQNVSIVTQIRGTTRDVVCCDLEIEGIKFNLNDTAGFRCAENEIEQLGIEKARQKLEQADLIIMVVDGSVNFFNDVFYEIEKQKNVLKICALNKADLGTFKFERGNLNFDLFIETSNKNLNSIYKLKKAMAELVKKKKLELGSFILINERQNFVINQAIDELQEAKRALEQNVGLDAVSVTIETAIDRILELNGQKISEKIVDEIFSKFCVGK